MPAYAIVGGQWGDEGKGKVVDFIAEKASIVARFSGGDNAGHTVLVNGREFHFHMLPSGMCRGNVTNLIGNGVVVNPDSLLEEIEGARAAGLSVELVLSDRAHLIMPYHLLIDELDEVKRGTGAIGTTFRGTGPAYADKVARRGIRVGELLEVEELIKNRLPDILDFTNLIIEHVYGGSPVSGTEIEEKLRHWAGELKEFIEDTTDRLRTAMESGQTLIAEGAQGSLLDIDHGTYPFVTSSNPIAGGAILGIGIGASAFAGVIGVFKAFCTRVGGGPFPTELPGEEAEIMRAHANEFGVTTGRPRRIGWFDAVAARYAVTVNGMDSAILTRLDTLDGEKFIPICNKYDLAGKQINYFPADSWTLAKCTPVYEFIDGWESSTRGATRWESLPLNAKNYVERIEQLIGLPIGLISTGPSREETIVRGTSASISDLLR